MPRNKEKRSSKSISMTPSLWADIQNLADSRGITASELIISTMSEIVRKNKKTTEKFLKTKAEFEKAKKAALLAAIPADDTLCITVEKTGAWFNLVCHKGNEEISSVNFQSHEYECESAAGFANDVLAIAQMCNVEVYQDEDDEESVIAAYVDEEGNEQTRNLYLGDKWLARGFVEFANEVLAADD